jgi:hypothetical protein
MLKDEVLKYLNETEEAVMVKLDNTPADLFPNSGVGVARESWRRIFAQARNAVHLCGKDEAHAGY